MSTGHEFKKGYYARLLKHYDGAVYALLIDGKQQDVMLPQIMSDNVESLVALASKFIKLSDAEAQSLRCYLEKEA